MPRSTSPLVAVNDTACRLSEYPSTSAPYLPWIDNIAIHHSDIKALIPPILAAVTIALRHVMVRPHAACRSHNTGAGAIIRIAVAFGAATVTMTRPKMPTSRQRLRVAARMVRPTSHPTAAHGSSIAEVRDTYGSTYGESW